MRNISGLCFLLSLLRFIPAFGGNDTHSLSSPAEEGEWRMYVCRGDSCHSFEVQNVDEVTFHPDSFHVERWWQYAYNETDSIVFRQPNLMTTEMGWWGDIRNGESCYLAHPYKDLFETTFEVCYRVTAQNGVCLSVNLELTFAEEWMAEGFLVFPTGEGDGDPYIYVKNTQTGPRKFEVWIMNNLVIPFGIPLEGDGCVLSADCSDLLAGRDMVEVKTIIEAWVQQPPELIEEKDYDAQAHVSGNNPVALTDATLLTALGNLSFGTLKERFHRLMKVGGMTEREMEELEMLLCS